MFEYECRHLPVVSDRGGQVIGMVSIRDLLGLDGLERAVRARRDQARERVQKGIRLPALSEHGR